jgi:hypothetical protein
MPTFPESGRLQAEAQQVAEELGEIGHALRAIESREISKTAYDRVPRDRAEKALAGATDQALAGAERERANHARAVDDADRALGELRQAAEDAAAALSTAQECLPEGGMPVEVRTTERAAAPARALLRSIRDGDPEPFIRPAATLAEIIPSDICKGAADCRGRRGQRRRAFSLAERRPAEARRLAEAQQQVLRVEAEAEHLRAAADEDARTAEKRATVPDAAAIALAQAWRAWTGDGETRQLLGQIDWATHRVIGLLILDAELLTGEDDGSLFAAWTKRPGRPPARPARRSRPNAPGSTSVK